MGVLIVVLQIVDGHDKPEWLALGLAVTVAGGIQAIAGALVSRDDRVFEGR